ncbi:sterile alpha motif domain-containing protein 15-like [Mercenaria mercenaria]|uniref:sterile alpha motif domain-containing protein 15-like n=1 Tax=Mercenaria mercenaria TaxID=6596 RepID=UPI00234EB1D7|nr:sterile alpha motif domain-containing protein 15-like [Mercenaria mercenaria]
MSFNQPCEYVRKTDEKHGVPMTIYWTEEELADWICEIGYPQYRVCFEKNFLSGRHLVYLDASKLPDIGITDFEHIKDIAGKIRGLIGLDHVIKNLSIAKSNPMIAYMDMKRKSGDVAMNIPYNEFLKKNKRWYK